ncbi:MAG TPA: benzoate-CoA ligase family protein [Vicinamibacteria bacterium]|nr:benzoate-CoA ligase family protein [Vicinamibacteria bacterium]
MLNAASWFVDRNVAEGRDRFPAFHCEGRTLTYADVQELVNRSGNALLELGIQREDRVALLCHDAPEFLGALWGAIKIGAVPVPINTFLKPVEWLYCLDDSRARVLVISAPLVEPAAAALERAAHLRHVLVAGGPAGPHLSYEDRCARAKTDLVAAATARDDPAFWLYSSGSTGAPKAAVHLQRDMVVCSETFARHVLGIRSTDTVFSAAKLFFAYGLGNSGYFPASVGAQCVLHPQRMTPALAFEVLTRHRPTLFFAGPALYAAMLALEDAPAREDLASLRLCVSAGESLPADIFLRWQDRYGVEIIDGIGTTECLHMFISNRPGAVKPGSSGQPVPGYDAAIVDERGAPVAPGEIGNLRIKGDSIMSGYWNQPEKTSAALRGGWIETGDKYYQDADGYFWHCGRSDDMLKVKGAWVSPVEVEAALIQHPALLQAAVVGHKDAEGLIKAKAFVVLRDPSLASDALAAELMTFAREKLPPYKCPRWVEFRTELPMTATGKIQRFKLRD